MHTSKKLAFSKILKAPDEGFLPNAYLMGFNQNFLMGMHEWCSISGQVILESRSMTPSRS